MYQKVTFSTSVNRLSLFSDWLVVVQLPEFLERTIDNGKQHQQHTREERHGQSRSQEKQFVVGGGKQESQGGAEEAEVAVAVAVEKTVAKKKRG